ncbi:MAG: Na/Pi symporter [Proteobacteria bacterium]|nr:Na/Pi symporter [Pseudomonadota bacterium]MBU1738899.1 Na/Pi symporter [Pseudomonadota bacterium]
MTTNFEFWKLLAGLSIFIYGMFMLEDSIKALSGRVFRKLISHYTRSKLRAVGSGAFVTAVLQSSSAVSLMILAFVGAGVMNMENAIAVMMGANIGTTFTAWIVALIGFKIKIESFALPIIALGGILLITSDHDSKFFSFSRLLIGLGFLFLGLDYMKGSAESLTSGFDLQSLPVHSLWIYLLVGIVLTAIMQASAATIALVMTALHSGLIDFQMALAMVVGANIGTTVTVLLGSMGKGVRTKKIVGISHLTFNCITGLIAFISLDLFDWLLRILLGNGYNSVTGLALFHTLFNLLGVIIFFPFINLLARTLIRIYPHKKTVLTLYLDRTPVEVADAATEALAKETYHLLEECQLYNLRSLRLDEKLIFDHDLPFEKNIGGKLKLKDLYDNIKLLHGEIFSFYTSLQSHKLEESEAKTLERLSFASRNIMNALKNFKGIQGDLEEFDSSENFYLNTQYNTFRKRLMELYHDLNRIRSLSGSKDQYRELVKTFLHLEETDKRFVSDTMKAVADNKIQDIDIASLLLANRLFNQACRLQLFSVKDIMLTPEQISDFDHALDMKELLEEEKKTEK